MCIINQFYSIKLISLKKKSHSNYQSHVHVHPQNPANRRENFLEVPRILLCCHHKSRMAMLIQHTRSF